MKRIIVLNAKGGCGKTTVATNVASGYAQRGFRTALIDYDPQESSIQWLRARSTSLPPIQGIAIHDASRVPLAGAWQLRVPRDAQRVVVDTPAGMRAMDLTGRLTGDDRLLIPVQPSPIDIRATADFIRDLLLVARVRPQDQRLALVGNRTRPSAALESLKAFLAHLQIPVLHYLRDGPLYPAAAEQGIGVCELPSTQSRHEHAGWQSILDWLEGGTAPALASAARPETADAGPVQIKAVPAAPARLPTFLITPPKNLN